VFIARDPVGLEGNRPESHSLKYWSRSAARQAESGFSVRSGREISAYHHRNSLSHLIAYLIAHVIRRPRHQAAIQLPNTNEAGEVLTTTALQTLTALTEQQQSGQH